MSSPVCSSITWSLFIYKKKCCPILTSFRELEWWACRSQQIVHKKNAVMVKANTRSPLVPSCPLFCCLEVVVQWRDVSSQNLWSGPHCRCWSQRDRASSHLYFAWLHLSSSGADLRQRDGWDRLGQKGLKAPVSRSRRTWKTKRNTEKRDLFIDILLFRYHTITFKPATK